MNKFMLALSDYLLAISLTNCIRKLNAIKIWNDKDEIFENK